MQTHIWETSEATRCHGILLCSDRPQGSDRFDKTLLQGDKISLDAYVLISLTNIVLQACNIPFGTRAGTAVARCAQEVQTCCVFFPVPCNQ